MNDEYINGIIKECEQQNIHTEYGQKRQHEITEKVIKDTKKACKNELYDYWLYAKEGYKKTSEIIDQAEIKGE